LSALLVALSLLLLSAVFFFLGHRERSEGEILWAEERVSVMFLF
jgi:hypothetical protein